MAAATAAASLGAQASGAAASAAVRNLDDLAEAGEARLTQLYASAAVPKLQDVDGPLVGRMLDIHILPASVTPFVRSLAAEPWFPWKGKTFTPRSVARGTGINRVFSERFSLFRFETFLGTSRAGAFDALQLDYDLPGNPPFIRAIKDEIRAVGKGLWLGQAYWHTSTRDHLVLWFALMSPQA
jgi:hypothetical protein